MSSINNNINLTVNKKTPDVNNSLLEKQKIEEISAHIAKLVKENLLYKEIKESEKSGVHRLNSVDELDD